MKICPTCGTKILPYDRNGRKRKSRVRFCSVGCSRKDPEVLRKQEETAKKRHGENWRSTTCMGRISNFTRPEVREKSRRTCMERYGSPHPSTARIKTDGFRRYRREVDRLTKRIYRIHKHEINPLDLPRTKAGVDGGYQLDHKISIREGFDRGMDPSILASKENLQMLPWLDNLLKYKSELKSIS